MTHQAAIALGQSLRILADSPDDGAALVAGDVVVGDYRSLEDLRRFAVGCDVVTFDHEHVPNEHLRALISDGVSVAPGPDALRFAQDKASMRIRLGELGIASPRWAVVPDLESLAKFGAEASWPLVLKASNGGYDGKGVWMVASIEQAVPIVGELLERGITILAEERVELRRELAAVVARSPFGQGAAWPVVETVQRDGICVEVIAPAPELDEEVADHAEALALRIAEELGVVGVLAVELFETTSGRLLVNELAMRPHNSGHWTIEGSRTSQFEQHVRAVLDYPLGSTTTTAPGVDERIHHFMAGWRDVKLHLYGKAFRPGRKVGHVTALGTELDEVRARARAAADYLMNGDRDEQ
jgi:5-(carboxyamino)imidazole ribonucleotide synthase